MVWSDAAQKLYLPITNPTLVGYVERGFDPKHYRVRLSDPENAYGLYQPYRGETVALVEDVLSAWRVSSVVDSMAILGVHISPAMQCRLMADGYTKAIVFLDGDNATVRMKARAIRSRLPFLSCRVVETGKDPKHYTHTELTELLS